MQTTENIGNRIRAVRGNMLQPAFADRMGVHKNTIGRWERGERLHDQRVLCKMLENHPTISPAWLLTGEGPMHRPTGSDQPVHRHGVNASDTEETINQIVLQLSELKQMTTAFSEAVRQEDESGQYRLDNYLLYGVLLQKIEEISGAVDSVQHNVSGEQNASRNEGGRS